MKQPKPAYQQRQLFNIGIFEDSTLLTDLRNETPKHFVISEQELANLLNLKTATVLRPESGLLFFKAEGRRQTYLFDVPLRSKPFELLLVKDVGQPPAVVRYNLPGFLLQMTVKETGGKRKVDGIKAYCYAGKKIRAKAPLYEMPLPNFSGNQMCLGSGGANVKDSVLEAGLSSVFDSSFNNHANLVGRKGLSFPEYLERYEGCAPISTLKRTSTYELQGE